VLIKTFSPFIENEDCPSVHALENRTVTKLDFFEDGLSGREGSSVLRESLARRLDLPHDMSANALLSAINLLYSYEQYKEYVKAVKEDKR
jgi:ribonuclease M5